MEILWYIQTHRMTVRRPVTFLSGLQNETLPRYLTLYDISKSEISEESSKVPDVLPFPRIKKDKCMGGGVRCKSNAL